MNYSHDLTEGTATLAQAVGILQGTRYDATPEEARRYLISMDMDVAFASSLVADMEADNFKFKILSLLRGEYVTTSYKSIAIWVRKFGFDATLNDTGDLWILTQGFNNMHHVHNNWDFPHPQSVSMGHAPHGFCRTHWRGCTGVGILAIAAAVFIGVWVFTGDIWAAIFLFEILFDILMEIADIF